MNDQMGGWSVAFCRTWNVTSQFGAWPVCLLNSNHFASLLLARFSVGGKKKWIL